MCSRPIEKAIQPQHEFGEYGAILEYAWEIGVSDDEITGYWSEDQTPYTITTPVETRDLIICMQNELHNRYTELQSSRMLLRKQEEALRKLLNVEV